MENNYAEMEKVLAKLAELLSKGRISEFRDCLADGCVYTSKGKTRADNADGVISSLEYVENYSKENGRSIFPWRAHITEDPSAEFGIGMPCLALAQEDMFNCVGSLTVALDSQGKVCRLNISIDPRVRFKIDGNPVDGFQISHFPSSAAEAVTLRCEALALLGRTDYSVLCGEAPDERCFDYVYEATGCYLKNGTDDVHGRLMNVGGYLYAFGMMTAFEGAFGFSLGEFSAESAVSGEKPEVDELYRGWINRGYRIGRTLCFPIKEYIAVRGVENINLGSEIFAGLAAIIEIGYVQAIYDIEAGLNNLLAEDSSCVSDEEADTIRESNASLKTAVGKFAAGKTTENFYDLIEALQDEIVNCRKLLIPYSTENGGFGFLKDRAVLSGEPHYLRLMQAEDGRYYFPCFTDYDELRKGPEPDVLAVYAGPVFKAFEGNPHACAMIIDPWSSHVVLDKQVCELLRQYDRNERKPE